MRKHRLAERLLIDVIGLDWELVHDEACRWEHVISEDVERKLVDLLHSPTESPYDNPIPGMDGSGSTGRRSTSGPATSTSTPSSAIPATAASRSSSTG